MQVRSVDDAREFRADRMAKTNLFETPRMFCDVYCLAPGQEQRVHAHAGEDKVYYVLEGEGTFVVGAEEQSLGPGHAVLAPAGEPHGVRNTSEAPVRLLVFMAPNPHAG
jgi:mannose-6-phosphate isomerase-like protein (cupin superfamily)